jgi:hypothetical protein
VNTVLEGVPLISRQNIIYHKENFDHRVDFSAVADFAV